MKKNTVQTYLIVFVENLAFSVLAFALSHTLTSTSGTISPKTSGTLLLSLPSKANSRHFSSQNISVKPHCPSLLPVCTVYVCVRACVRAYACVRACVRACVCVRVRVCVCVRARIFCIINCRYFLFFIFWDIIFHLDVQRFEPQGRPFTNFDHYYYYYEDC